MAQILGGILAVFMLSSFLKYLVFKITKKDILWQRAIINIVAIAIASIVYMTLGRTSGETEDYIVGGVLGYFIGGSVVFQVFVLRLIKKQFFLAIIYSIVIWFLLTCILELSLSAFGVTGATVNITVSTLDVFMGSVLAGLLVIKQKLPFTKLSDKEIEKVGLEENEKWLRTFLVVSLFVMLALMLGCIGIAMLSSNPWLSALCFLGLMGLLFFWYKRRKFGRG